MKIDYRSGILAGLIWMSAPIFGYLGYQYLAPYGRTVENTFVQTLPGAEIITSIDEAGLAITKSYLKTKSTHFSLSNPKNLAEIKVKAEYKSGQSEIRFGVRGNETDPFTYRSLYFAPLADMNWNSIEENGLRLYQKEPKFDSISDFLKNPPVGKKVGRYQIDPGSLVPMIYPPEIPTTTTVSTAIRGSATAYILVTSGPLKIDISKQDINMYEGEDVLKIYLYRNGTKVFEKIVPDDGLDDKNRNQTAPQVTTIDIPNAKPGIYKLEMELNSEGADSYISKIEVNQKQVMFDGSLLVWGGANTTLYTNATKITANTSWPENIQNLMLDDKKELAIKTIKTDYSFDLENGTHKIVVPKGNISIKTTGYMAFAPEGIFDPQLIKMQTLDTTSTTDKYDYILTNLKPVTVSGEIITSELSLNPQDFDLTGENIYFSLEIPELEKHGGLFEIDKLDITLVTK